MKTVKNIIHNALIQAINYEITILESCSHMLDDPMAKRSLHSALEFAEYYEKRFKKPNPFKDELNLWKEKSDKIVDN